MAHDRLVSDIKLPVVISEGENGYLMANVPVIPGCTSHGRALEDAPANVKQAAELCLECREEEGWELPGKYRSRAIEVLA